MKEITCFGIKPGYFIDEYGTIISTLQKEPREMATRVDKDGYLSLLLVCLDGKRRYFRVHRLVAGTFLENPRNYPVVMHKDNNPQNNHFSNLQWGTVAQNTQDAYKDGLCSWNIPVLLYKGEEFVQEFPSVNEVSRYFNYRPGSTTWLGELLKSGRIVERGKMAGYRLEPKIPYESVTTIP